MYTKGGHDRVTYFTPLREFLLGRQRADGSWANGTGPGRVQHRHGVPDPRDPLRLPADLPPLMSTRPHWPRRASTRSSAASKAPCAAASGCTASGPPPARPCGCCSCTAPTGCSSSRADPADPPRAAGGRHPVAAHAHPLRTGARSPTARASRSWLSARSPPPRRWTTASSTPWSSRARWTRRRPRRSWSSASPPRPRSRPADRTGPRHRRRAPRPPLHDGRCLRSGDPRRPGQRPGPRTHLRCADARRRRRVPRATTLSLEVPADTMGLEVDTSDPERIVVRAARGRDVPLIVRAEGVVPELVSLSFDSGAIVDPDRADRTPSAPSSPPSRRTSAWSSPAATTTAACRASRSSCSSRPTSRVSPSWSLPAYSGLPARSARRRG